MLLACKNIVNTAKTAASGFSDMNL